MFEPETRDERVGGAAPFSVSRVDERACFPRGVTTDATPMQVHETMHLACAARASLDALPAVFELMPAITYANTNGEEKTIEKAPCTH